jgi:alpha-1,3-rhamnosyl/mannosyltransferase
VSAGQVSAGQVSAGQVSAGQAGERPHDGPIEVLVNLMWLVPGVVGGSEESVTDALRAVLDTDVPQVRLRLAVLEPFASAHPDLAAAVPIHVAPLDGRDKLRRVLAEQTWLAALTRRVAPDVVHHAGGTVPFVHPAPVVLTIQDLQPLDLPANFSLVKRNYLRAMLGRSARAARVVQVPSEFTRSRVVQLLGVDPAAVRVVPWAPRPAPQHPGAPAPGAVPEGAFLLYPAITYPHKNHLVLLDAVAALEGPAASTTLVLTGGSAATEHDVVCRIAELGLTERVWRTGRVDQDRLEQLYAAASAVVVPSRYEGFGLPALEAMVRGCPVVVSSAGSLPEVARPEDLVDPDDVTGWTDAVQAVLALSATARNERVRSGRDRAAQFSPERTAAGLIDAYRAAAHPQPHHRTPT